MNAPTIRQISVPTTLSGGEFSAIAGVTDERTKVKELLRHPRIMPSAVILDPAITAHTPEWLWLSTGIRAVDHCVEGVCSNEANAYADAQALKFWRSFSVGYLASRPIQKTSRHGSIAKWAHGCPWVPSPAAYRWERAMESAMSLALNSGCHMGTRPALCFRRSCAGTSWPMRIDRPRSPLPCPMRVAMQAMCLMLSLAASICRGALGRSKSGATIERIAKQAMGTPWVPRNPRPIAGPAQVREILELAA